VAERQYVQKEWRLLGWWLALKHPHADISMNVRLGPPQPGTTLSAMSPDTGLRSRVFNRYADCVFVENGDPYIVEAKLDSNAGIYSQLIHYARKFRRDPNWQAYENRPLHLIALVYHDDPDVAIEAPWYGVRWEVFQPDLIELAPPRVRLPVLDAAGEAPYLPSNWAMRLNSWGIKALQG